MKLKVGSRYLNYLQKILFSIFLLAYLQFGMTNAQGNGKIIFRMDDFGLDNEEFYPNLFQIFQKYRAKLLVGIVPFKVVNGNMDSLSERQIEIIKSGIDMGVVEIAQHGYSHKNNAPDGEYDSEFTGLSETEQFKKIKSGKAYLERTLGVPINIFIPPWNAYDQNTIIALSRCGIGIISASLRDYGLTKDYGIKFAPVTASLSEFANYLVENKSHENELLIVLFHGYDFQENLEFYKSKYIYNVNLNPITDLSKFEKLIIMTQEAGLNINTTISFLAHVSEDLSLNRLKNNFSIEIISHIPNFLKLNSEPIYREVDTIDVIGWLNFVLTIVFFLLLIFIGYILTPKFSFISNKGIKRVFKVMIIMGSFGIIVFICYDGIIGEKGYYILATIIGIILSVITKPLTISYLVKR